MTLANVHQKFTWITSIGNTEGNSGWIDDDYFGLTQWSVVYVIKLFWNIPRFPKNGKNSSLWWLNLHKNVQHCYLCISTLLNCQLLCKWPILVVSAKGGIEISSKKTRFITLTPERIDRKHLVMIPEVVELKPDVHHLFSGQNFEAMCVTNELLFCLK